MEIEYCVMIGEMLLDAKVRLTLVLAFLKKN